MKEDGREGFVSFPTVADAASGEAKAKEVEQEDAPKDYMNKANEWIEKYNKEPLDLYLTNAINAYRQAVKENKNPKLAADDAKKAIEALIIRYPNLKDKLETEKKIIDNIVYMNTQYPGWFGQFGRILDITQNFWLFRLVNNQGYPHIAGLSYDNNDDPWFELGDKWNNYLSGPQGVAAELCKSAVAISDLDGGFATSSNVGGPYATIEGEKITIINHTDPTPDTFYYYKISIDIYPGTSVLGCDLKFQIYLLDKNNNKVHLMLENESSSPYTWDIKRGDPTVSFKGPDMYVRPSKKEYKKVCIDFQRIIPREERSCLIGIEEGDAICSIIKEGETHEFDLKCHYCDSSGAKFWTLGFSGWKGKGEPSGTTPSGSGTPSSEEEQPRPNDI